MAFGSISDTQIIASSQLDGNHSASQARLHFQADGYKVGGWSALTNDRDQWLQVDFGSYTKVTRLATQGMNGYDQWVTRYMLQYSDDGITFHLYKEGTRYPKLSLSLPNYRLLSTDIVQITFAAAS